MNIKSTIGFLWVAACLLTWAATSNAASLTVANGETITFNTTDGTWSIDGGDSGTGTLINESAVIDETTWNYSIRKFTFDSIDFQSGSTVTLTGTNALWLASDGNFTVNTTIGPAAATNRIGALGGYDGGDELGAWPGHGPGGAPDPGDQHRTGGGGGHGGAGGAGHYSSGGSTYNTADLNLGLIGGSGGACGVVNDSRRGLGGAGGAAIRLSAANTLAIDISGVVRAVGMHGEGNTIAGGGGSGGTIEMRARTGSITVHGSAQISARGGDRGTGYYNGGGGGGGRIHFDTLSLEIDGVAQTEGSLSASSQLIIAGGSNNGSPGSIYFTETPPPKGTVISIK